MKQVNSYSVQSMRALGARPRKYMRGYTLQYRKALAMERIEE